MDSKLADAEVRRLGVLARRPRCWIHKPGCVTELHRMERTHILTLRHEVTDRTDRTGSPGGDTTRLLCTGPLPPLELLKVLESVISHNHGRRSNHLSAESRFP